jgi:hypothetical protein
LLFSQAVSVAATKIIASMQRLMILSLASSL